MANEFQEGNTQVSVPEENRDETEIDLVGLFFLLVHNLPIIILSFLVGFLGVFGVLKIFVTPQYEASSMIYVLGKTTSISDAINLQLSKQLTTDFTVLATSRQVINAVIQDMSLDTSYEKLRSSITVENPSNTSILKITVSSPDPYKAADLSNAMAQATAERIAEVMVTDRPSQVESAVVPKTPYTPNFMKDSAIGGLVAALLAIGILSMVYVMDDTVKDEEDVRKYLDTATLAEFPMEKVLEPGSKKHHRRKK